MKTLWGKAVVFIRNEEGPTATEYAVLLAVIAIAALVSFASFGDGMSGIYTAVSGAVDVF